MPRHEGIEVVGVGAGTHLTSKRSTVASTAAPTVRRSQRRGEQGTSVCAVGGELVLALTDHRKPRWACYTNTLTGGNAPCVQHQRLPHTHPMAAVWRFAAAHATLLMLFTAASAELPNSHLYITPQVGREKSGVSGAPDDCPSKPFTQRVAQPKSMALLPRLMHPSLDVVRTPGDQTTDSAHAESSRSADAAALERSAAASPVPGLDEGESGHSRSAGGAGKGGREASRPARSHGASPSAQRPHGNKDRGRKGHGLVQLSAALQTQRNGHSPVREPGRSAGGHPSLDLSHHQGAAPRFPAYSKSSPQAIAATAATWRAGRSHSPDLGREGSEWEVGHSHSSAAGPTSPLALPPVGLHGRLQLRAHHDPLKAAMETVSTATTATQRFGDHHES